MKPLEDKLITSLNRDWISRQNHLETTAAKGYLQGLSQTLIAFKEIRKSDIHVIVDMEILTSKHEKQLYGKDDPTVSSSLQAAIDSLKNEVKGSIKTAEIPEDYQKAALTHSSKKLHKGVPIDVFHEAVNGHMTRLENRIRTVGVPVPEKNVLMARKENMRQAKDLYVELQQKALGVEPPSKAKSKGLEL